MAKVLLTHRDMLRLRRTVYAELRLSTRRGIDARLDRECVKHALQSGRRMARWLAGPGVDPELIHLGSISP